MSKFFEKPILLIEFDENEEFRLVDKWGKSIMNSSVNNQFSKSKVNEQSIISKISLLTLHFKKL